MPTIYDVITPADTRAYYENVERKTYLGEALFPATKQLGLDLSFLKGRGGLPIALQPAAFDALAPLRDRIGVEAFNTEMPFFRERMLVKEKDRQQINSFLAANQSAQAELIIREVFKDAEALIAGADVITELMRMQLLSTGAISIQGTAEGRAVDYNYRLANDQFETLVGTDAWTSPDSDPIANIEEWVEQSGATRAILNNFTFGLLRKHPKVIGAVSAVTGKQFVSKTEIVNFFREEVGVSFAIYDEKYQISQDAAAEKFWPDFVFTLIPDGTLGETVYGTTPEEADLLNGQATDAEVSIVNTGVAVTTVKIPHPVNVQTIVSMIALPSFPMADKVFIATVGAE